MAATSTSASAPWSCWSTRSCSPATAWAATPSATLLLLADVSLPLQEEEQAAGRRLLRVLGHELSNSLAPIKSIAGSLLARVDHMDGDADTIRDFRRGLGVVESRADALHRFVQSYRLLAQLPPPHLRPVNLGTLLEQVILLEQRLTVRFDAGQIGRAH